MRDQYVGDIGDYVKYGLLRALAPAPKKLGVIWYKTAGGQQGSDGRYTEYLHAPKTYREGDAILFDTLHKLICEGNKRNIAEVEQSVLPDAYCFSRIIENNAREKWFADACDKVKSCDLVFADPDNGLTIEKSVSDKHISLDEIKRLSGKFNSVIIYHHQTRRKGGHKCEIEFWQNELNAKTGKRVSSIRAAAYSPRTFFLVTDDAGMKKRFKQFSDKWKFILKPNREIPHYYKPLN